MKIIQLKDVPYRENVAQSRVLTGHRNKTILTSTILNRDPNRLDNFYFGMSWVDFKGGFFTPRHRHDFSQFRYMIEGEADYHVGELQTDGVLNYSPEGAYYGPQKDGVGALINCQFGDASGNGYIDRSQFMTALVEMKQKNEGVFEDGSYHRNPGVEGKPIQDANEAVFEYIRGRPVEYPPTQYLHTILVNSNNIPWFPVDGAPGVAERDMGAFGLCRNRVAQYKLDAGATFVANGRGIYFVLSGAGKVEAEPLEQYTTTYLEEGEQASFTAGETTIIILLGLPTLAAIEKSSAALRAMVAEKSSAALEPVAAH